MRRYDAGAACKQLLLAFFSKTDRTPRPRESEPREKLSLSPKAVRPKAGRSDFRNQRFEPDTGKMRKMRKVPLTLEK